MFNDSLDGRLFKTTKEVSSRFYFGESKGVRVGGASDAELITEVGVPCFCGMGVKG